MATDFRADYTVGVVPFTVRLSVETTETVTSYLWDFGDGATSYRADPSHEYNNAGSYNVTLTVQTDSGEIEVRKLGYIKVGRTSVSYQTSGMHSPVVATLTDNSYFPPGVSVAGRLWDFGDGETLSTVGSTAVHSYTTSGQYSVSLKLTVSYD